MEEAKQGTEQSIEEQGTLSSDNECRSARKHFSRLGLAYVLGTVAIMVAQGLMILLVGMLRPEEADDPNLNLIMNMLGFYAIGAPLLVLFAKKLVPAKAPKEHSMKAGHLILAAMMCFALMYISNIIGLCITQVISLIKGDMVGNVMVDVAFSTNPFLLFAFTVLCAPVMEEYLFRKLLVDRTVRYGQGVAVLLSGLMFGLFHGNLNQFAYAFGLGAFFAFLYVKTGRIRYTIILHMIINFIGSVASTLIMNGIDLEAIQEASLSNDPVLMMEAIMADLPAWILYMGFAFFVFTMMITGTVLFIVFRKRFRLEKGEVVIPKGKRFKTVILNVGMLCFILFWVVMIIWQLLL